MIMKTHTRIGILSLVIGVTLLSMAASGAATTNATQKKCSIAVHLENRNVTREQLAKELRKQLDSSCKASVSEKEVQDAANNALNLISKSNDPLKWCDLHKYQAVLLLYFMGQGQEFLQGPLEPITLAGGPKLLGASSRFRWPTPSLLSPFNG